ncbi:PAS domain S-box protein [Halobacteriales archaeon Cl-PHB]
MEPRGLTTSLRETLDVFETTGDVCEPLTTAEVTEQLDVSRRSTYERLERLVEEGVLRTKKAGARGRIWWQPPAGEADEVPDWSAAAESLVDDVLGSAEVAVFVLDDDFDVAWINDATERYFGLDRETVLGRDKREVVRSTITGRIDDSDAFADQVLATYADNTYAEHFECHVTPGEDRQERWLEHRSRPVESGAFAGGRVELYYDVTDRVESERERRSEREQFRSLVDAVEEYAIFMLDEAGHVQTWNPGAEQIKGYEPQDIIGKHFSTFYTDQDVAAGVPAENLERAAEQGQVEHEGWRLRQDGSAFWASVTLTTIRDEEGDLEGFAKVTRDMTERRERERRLAAEKAFTESMFENQRDVVYAYDTEGTFLRWNDRLAEASGYSDAEIATMQPPAFIADDHAEETEAVMTQVIEDGESVEVELPLETADGEEIPYEFTASPMTDADGEVVGVTGVGRDVTERKKKERRLRRQRDDLESELADVFDRVSDGFYALDRDLGFTYLNGYAETILEVDESTVVGRDIREALDLSEDFETDLVEALEVQEPVHREEYAEPVDRWFTTSIYPSESGLSVYFQDVTERHERERQLEETRNRFETLIEHFPNGAVAIVNQDLEYATFGGTLEGDANLSRADLEGGYLPDVLPEELADAVVPGYETALAGNSTQYEETVDGRQYQYHFVPVRDDDGDVFAATAMSQDVTEQRRRQRELQEAKTQLEAATEAGAVGTWEWHVPEDEFVAGPSFARTFGVDPEAARDGVSIQQFVSSIHLDDRDRVQESIQATLETCGEFEEEYRVQNADGDYRWVLAKGAVECDDDGEPLTFPGTVTDITERKRYEQELERRVRQQQAVSDLGEQALESHDLDGLMAEAASVVADVLDHDYCKVLDLDPEAEELLLRQGVGWHEGVVGAATVSAVEDDSQAAQTLAVDEPVVVEDLETETRFAGPDLLTDHEVQSGISVIIGSWENPWGILGTHDTAAREFSDHDVAFVQSVANILATAIERTDYEERLLRQREQLQAVNHLNEVVQGITDAVVEQSTREEIEQTVVAGLADAESFTHAWIGDVDGPSNDVQLRAEAGVEEYLEDVTITVDPDDDRSSGPTAQALLTGEMQVTQDITRSEGHDPWRDHVEQYDFQSSAAIPVVHEGTTYGVLNVYADRPFAFEDAERRVLSQLGEVVGHAIAAVERKRALMSDEVVELEYRIESVASTLGLEGSLDGRITLDQVVPAGAGDYLVYGTVTEAARDGLAAIVAGLGHWEAVTYLGDTDGTQRFELRVSEPPVLSEVAARGGYVEQAVIEDGDYHMTVHLPPTIDVRSVTDAVTDAYPTVDLVAQRQFSRTGDDAVRFEQLLHDELTERQRGAVEAAYHAGFFEWPRENDGETVADSLDVSPPTFHQHLRKAEQKVFETLLTDGGGDGDGET